MHTHNFNVYDILKRNARLFKNATALVCANDRITFGEFLKKVQSLSGSLLNQKVCQGDRIAIIAKNCHNFFMLYGAAAAIGDIIVPINWRLSIEEIQYILQDSTPYAIFFDEDYIDIISQIRTECKSLQKFFVFGKSKSDFISFSEIIGDYPFQEIEFMGNDPYIIFYTAAIKGQPRGAVLSQENIVFSSIQVISMMGLTSNNTYLNTLPMFHIGDIVPAFSVMHAGGKNVIISRFDPKAVLQMIEKEQVTITSSFPPILSQLINEMSERAYKLSSLKQVFGLLECQNIITDFERKTSSQFWLLYGQTETTALNFLCPNSEKPGSSGRQGPLVDIKIVDEYNRELRIGEKGEILIRSPLVFQGYWKQDELNKYTFRHGWHHTGDVGYLDEEGYLWFCGRKSEKELIKSGGENVYPAEVENIILTHPDIKEVGVIGVSDKTFGEGIKAICVLKPNVKLSEQELTDFVANRIARYKKPRYVLFVDSLPKKDDGSIDREKLKLIYGNK